MSDKFEVITYEEALPAFEEINPRLANAINSLELNHKHKIIKLKYAFGEEIVKNGTLLIPIKGKLYTIDSPEVPNYIREELSYSSIPIGVCINKTLEGYGAKENHLVIPHSIYNPGDIVGGMFNLSHSKENFKILKYWNLSAGNRSLYLLPKMSDDRSFARLKKTFNFDLPKPTSMIHQHDIFKSISNSDTSNNKWEAEIFFFTKEWFNESNNSYKMFQYFLYQNLWTYTKGYNQQLSLSYEVSYILEGSNLKTNPYVLDTLYYFYGILESSRPCFFISDSDRAAPVSLLQEAFVDVYKLTKIPLFIEANAFSRMSKLSAYFSFALPTLIRFAPKSRKTSRILKIIELYDLMQRLKNYRKYDPTETFETIDKLFDENDFQFYHMERNDSANFLYLPEDLIEYDKSISSYLDLYPNLELSVTDIFFRGCVRISKK